jgi:hypothetical protein
MTSLIFLLIEGAYIPDVFVLGRDTIIHYILSSVFFLYTLNLSLVCHTKFSDMPDVSHVKCNWQGSRYVWLEAFQFFFYLVS